MAPLLYIVLVLSLNQAETPKDEVVSRSANFVFLADALINVVVLVSIFAVRLD